MLQKCILSKSLLEIWIRAAKLRIFQWQVTNCSLKLKLSQSMFYQQHEGYVTLKVLHQIKNFTPLSKSLNTSKVEPVGYNPISILKYTMLSQSTPCHFIYWRSFTNFYAQLYDVKIEFEDQKEIIKHFTSKLRFLIGDKNKSPWFSNGYFNPIVTNVYFNTWVPGGSFLMRLLMKNSHFRVEITIGRRFSVGQNLPDTLYKTHEYAF